MIYYLWDHTKGYTEDQSEEEVVEEGRWSPEADKHAREELRMEI